MTNTAFSFHWHAHLHLQGPGMLRLKVSAPGMAIQLSKIYPHFFKEKIVDLHGEIFSLLIFTSGEVVQNQNILSTYLHVEKDA